MDNAFVIINLFMIGFLLAMIIAVAMLCFFNWLGEKFRKPVKWDGKYWKGRKNIQDMPYEWQDKTV